MATLTQNIATGTSLLQLEYRFRCADGSYKYVLDRAFLIMDMHNKPVRMIGAMQDITTKKIEEERLRLLESVITNATDGIVITEVADNDIDNSKIVYVNEAFIKLTGYVNEEIIGKTLHVLEGAKTSEEELCKLKNAIILGESCTIEIVNYKKKGEEFWANISVAPVADNKGKITHWIAIHRDVSDKRNYLSAIEEQNKKLKEIAWIQSHVVRAPLARIMGLANMLIEQVPIEEIKNDELVESISTSAEELDKIIRDIVYKTENVQNQTKL
jgi:PAS domain S-box-containing protein